MEMILTSIDHGNTLYPWDMPERNIPWYVVSLTALNTGMRREEILSLEWEKHVDLAHGFILLGKTHDLRHTFASHLVIPGVDITTVKELLEHKYLSMTIHYSHLAPSHKAAAPTALDSTFQIAPTLHLLDSRADQPSMRNAKDC